MVQRRQLNSRVGAIAPPPPKPIPTFLLDQALRPPATAALPTRSACSRCLARKTGLGADCATRNLRAGLPPRQPPIQRSQCLHGVPTPV
jgi:hypothetical protein